MQNATARLYADLPCGLPGDASAEAFGKTRELRLG
jgi:hypothetical protein